MATQPTAKLTRRIRKSSCSATCVEIVGNTMLSMLCPTLPSNAVSTSLFIQLTNPRWPEVYLPSLLTLRSTALKSPRDALSISSFPANAARTATSIVLSFDQHDHVRPRGVGTNSHENQRLMSSLASGIKACRWPTGKQSGIFSCFTRVKIFTKR